MANRRSLRAKDISSQDSARRITSSPVGKVVLMHETDVLRQQSSNLCEQLKTIQLQVQRLQFHFDQQLQKTLSTIPTFKNESADQIDNFNEDIKRLKEENDDCKEKIKNLEQENDALKEEIMDLKRESSNIREESRRIQQENNRLDQEYRRFEHENRGLRQENDRFSDENNRLKQLL